MRVGGFVAGGNVRGKSGQQRAPRFLTESRPRGRIIAEENNRLPAGKGEKVG